jgi:hypothetical protein
MIHDDNIQTIDSFINRFPDYKELFSKSKNTLETLKHDKTKVGYIGLYTILNIGMGCCVYIRHNKVDNIVLGYFLHGDCYGQYGESTDDYKKAQDFVHGYMLINQ